MHISTKLGGTAILVAALLNITRMIPVFAGGNVDLQKFPPETAAEIAQLANGPGHLLSHFMALASFPLLLLGFLMLYQVLVERQQQALALTFIVAMGTGLMLYTIATIIDGFVTPIATQNLVTASPPSLETADFLVTYTHKTALSFFGPAVFALMVGVSVLGFGLSRANLYRHGLGWTGAGLGLVFAVGYLTGTFGLRLEHNFQVAGLLSMLMNLWLLTLGIGLIRQTPSHKALPVMSTLIEGVS